MPPKESSPEWRAAQGGLLLGDGGIWRLRYSAQDYNDYHDHTDVCARGEGLAWLQLAWANESGLRDGLGGEHGAGEDRIVDRTDKWGEEQGTSVSNMSTCCW